MRIRPVLHTTSRGTVAAAVAALTGAFSSTVSIAQDSTPAAGATTPQIEEVVVTARRREESAQRVSVALNAFTGEALELRKIENLEAVVMRTPGAIFVGRGVSNPALHLRGVGANSQDAAAESPVSVYVDEVYVGRVSGVDFGLYDLERVEVLRGPQGTLFGRNSSAGVVQFITTKPKSEPEARVSATVGDFKRLGFDALSTGPLSDSVSYKLVGSAHREDGYIVNQTTGNDVNGIDRVFARGALRFAPSDTLEVLLSSDVSHERGTSAANDTEYSPTAPFPPRSDASRFTTNALGDGQQDRDLFNVTLRASSRMNWGELASITGYRRNDYKQSFYFAGNPRTSDTVESLRSEVEAGRQFSQELRISGTNGRLDWIGGLYFLDLKVDHLTSFDQWFDALFRALGQPQSAWSAGNGMIFFNNRAKMTSYAGFGQLTYQFAEDWRLTAGVRYTRDELSSRVVATTNPPNAAPVGLSTRGGYDTGELSRSWTATTPHVSLQYQVTPDAMLYASATEGYKSGTFAGTAATIADAVAPLEPEQVESYELGAKTDWFDRRLRVNLNGFYAEFEDLQIGTLIPGQAIVRANASAMIRGAELQLTVVPAEGLTIDISHSYLNSKYTDPTRRGRIVAKSPKNKTNLFVAYTFPTTGPFDVTLRADYTRTGMFFMQPDNRPTETQGAYDLVDLGLDLTTRDDRWKVSLYGKNVTDEIYRLAQTALPQIGQNFVIYGAPRKYGVTITRQF